ncbi:MFS family permease [Anoxybacillus rupiensis]|nr:MFS family permease [Anoxybacillus rupiensis]
MMTISLLLTSLLTMASALLSHFPSLVLARALLGMAAAGVPSLAMAYITEEFQAEGIGKAMGLYLAEPALEAWLDE